MCTIKIKLIFDLNMTRDWKDEFMFIHAAIKLITIHRYKSVTKSGIIKIIILIIVVVVVFLVVVGSSRSRSSSSIIKNLK